MTNPIPTPGATPPAGTGDPNPPVPAPPAGNPTPPVNTPPAGTRDPLDEPLGETGLRALHAERDARKEAEKQRALLEQQLNEFKQREMTELQKAQAQAADWEQKFNETSAQNTKNSIALEFGITGEDLVFLSGSTEADIRAQATRLKALNESRNGATPPAFTPNPGQSVGNGNPPAPTATVDAGRALYAQRNQKTN